MSLDKLLLGLAALTLAWGLFRFVVARVGGYAQRFGSSPTLRRRSVGYGLLLFLLVGIAALSLAWTRRSETSTASIRSAETACVNWFKTDSDLGARDAFLDRSWKKDGHIVVEVGFDKRGSSYSSRLCVFDPEQGRMTAPNNFTRSRWE